MLQIPIRVAGDQWFNQQQVIDLLATAQDCEIELDLGAEGPSLHRLGVVDTVLAAGIDPAKVSVTNWPNAVENIPFQRAVLHRVSHFFWHHKLHQTSEKFVNCTDNIFGLFIGRRTLARCRIFHDVFSQYRNRSFLSLMKHTAPSPWYLNNFINIESSEPWAPDVDQKQFFHWWENPPVDSVDQAEVRDQYRNDCNTNFSLLKFYNQFDIEIVCETYCYGDAFFPTEKTVRPIAAGKPFVAFAPLRFLERLKNLGFKTYSDFWDESYDKLEGLARWRAMQTVLESIAQQYNTSWVDHLNSVAEYNRQHLKDIVNQYQPL